jgi:hypothetical protein
LRLAVTVDGKTTTDPLDDLGRMRDFWFFHETSGMSVLPGRESVPRTSGPVRGTESQSFSFGERFALEKFNAHRLEWLVRTLALPVPGFALRHFGSFLFFVLLPLVSWKNPNFPVVGRHSVEPFGCQAVHKKTLKDTSSSRVFGN